MAFRKKYTNEILGTVLVLSALLSTASAVDCYGKSFHCVNSTHFMICVDLGGGVSQSIDNFLIPCPPPTVCQGNNHFECEFPVSTTPSTTLNDVVSETTQPWEEIAVTTNSELGNTTKEYSEKYMNTVSITSVSEDSFTKDSMAETTTEKYLPNTELNNNVNVSQMEPIATESLNYDTTMGLDQTAQTLSDRILSSTAKLTSNEPVMEAQNTTNSSSAPEISTDNTNLGTSVTEPASKIFDSLSPNAAMETKNATGNFGNENITRENAINRTTSPPEQPLTIAIIDSTSIGEKNNSTTTQNGLNNSTSSPDLLTIESSTGTEQSTTNTIVANNLIGEQLNVTTSELVYSENVTQDAIDRASPLPDLSTIGSNSVIEQQQSTADKNIIGKKMNLTSPSVFTENVTQNEIDLTTSSPDLKVIKASAVTEETLTTAATDSNLDDVKLNLATSPSAFTENVTQNEINLTTSSPDLKVNNASTVTEQTLTTAATDSNLNDVKLNLATSPSAFTENVTPNEINLTTSSPDLKITNTSTVTEETLTTAATDSYLIDVKLNLATSPSAFTENGIPNEINLTTSSPDLKVINASTVTEQTLTTAATDSNLNDVTLNLATSPSAFTENVTPNEINLTTSSPDLKITNTSTVTEETLTTAATDSHLIDLKLNLATSPSAFTENGIPNEINLTTSSPDLKVINASTVTEQILTTAATDSNLDDVKLNLATSPSAFTENVTQNEINLTTSSPDLKVNNASTVTEQTLTTAATDSNLNDVKLNLATSPSAFTENVTPNEINLTTSSPDLKITNTSTVTEETLTTAATDSYLIDVKLNLATSPSAFTENGIPNEINLTTSSPDLKVINASTVTEQILTTAATDSHLIDLKLNLATSPSAFTENVIPNEINLTTSSPDLKVINASTVTEQILTTAATDSNLNDVKLNLATSPSALTENVTPNEINLTSSSPDFKVTNASTVTDQVLTTAATDSNLNVVTLNLATSPSAFTENVTLNEINFTTSSPDVKITNTSTVTEETLTTAATDSNLIDVKLNLVTSPPAFTENMTPNEINLTTSSPDLKISNTSTVTEETLTTEATESNLIDVKLNLATSPSAFTENVVTFGVLNEINLTTSSPDLKVINASTVTEQVLTTAATDSNLNDVTLNLATSPSAFTENVTPNEINPNTSSPDLKITNSSTVTEETLTTAATDSNLIDVKLNLVTSPPAFTENVTPNEINLTTSSPDLKVINASTMIEQILTTAATDSNLIDVKLNLVTSPPAFTENVTPNEINLTTSSPDLKITNTSTVTEETLTTAAAESNLIDVKLDLTTSPSAFSENVTQNEINLTTVTPDLIVTEASTVTEQILTTAATESNLVDVKLNVTTPPLVYSDNENMTQNATNKTISSPDLMIIESSTGTASSAINTTVDINLIGRALNVSTSESMYAVTVSENAIDRTTSLPDLSIIGSGTEREQTLTTATTDNNFSNKEPNLKISQPVAIENETQNDKSPVDIIKISVGAEQPSTTATDESITESKNHEQDETATKSTTAKSFNITRFEENITSNATFNLATEQTTVSTTDTVHNTAQYLDSSTNVAIAHDDNSTKVIDAVSSTTDASAFFETSVMLDQSLTTTIDKNFIAENNGNITTVQSVDPINIIQNTDNVNVSHPETPHRENDSVDTPVTLLPEQTTVSILSSVQNTNEAIFSISNIVTANSDNNKITTDAISVRNTDTSKLSLENNAKIGHPTTITSSDSLMKSENPTLTTKQHLPAQQPNIVNQEEQTSLLILGETSTVSKETQILSTSSYVTPAVSTTSDNNIKKTIDNTTPKPTTNTLIDESSVGTEQTLTATTDESFVSVSLDLLTQPFLGSTDINLDAISLNASVIKTSTRPTTPTNSSSFGSSVTDETEQMNPNTDSEIYNDNNKYIEIAPTTRSPFIENGFAAEQPATIRKEGFTSRVNDVYITNVPTVMMKTESEIPLNVIETNQAPIELTTDTSKYINAEQQVNYAQKKKGFTPEKQTVPVTETQDTAKRIHEEVLPNTVLRIIKNKAMDKQLEKATLTKTLTMESTLPSEETLEKENKNTLNLVEVNTVSMPETSAVFITTSSPIAPDVSLLSISEVVTEVNKKENNIVINEKAAKTEQNYNEGGSATSTTDNLSDNSNPSANTSFSNKTTSSLTSNMKSDDGHYKDGKSTFEKHQTTTEITPVTHALNKDKTLNIQPNGNDVNVIETNAYVKGLDSVDSTDASIITSEGDPVNQISQSGFTQISQSVIDKETQKNQTTGRDFNVVQRGPYTKQITNNNGTMTIVKQIFHSGVTNISDTIITTSHSAMVPTTEQNTASQGENVARQDVQKSPVTISMDLSTETSSIITKISNDSFKKNSNNETDALISSDSSKVLSTRKTKHVFVTNATADLNETLINISNNSLQIIGTTNAIVDHLSEKNNRSANSASLTNNDRNELKTVKSNVDSAVSVLNSQKPNKKTSAKETGSIVNTNDDANQHLQLSVLDDSHATKPHIDNIDPTITQSSNNPMTMVTSATEKVMLFGGKNMNTITQQVETTTKMVDNSQFNTPTQGSIYVDNSANIVTNKLKNDPEFVNAKNYNKGDNFKIVSNSDHSIQTLRTDYKTVPSQIYPKSNTINNMANEFKIKLSVTEPATNAVTRPEVKTFHGDSLSNHKNNGAPSTKPMSDKTAPWKTDDMTQQSSTNNYDSQIIPSVNKIDGSLPVLQENVSNTNVNDNSITHKPDRLIITSNIPKTGTNFKRKAMESTAVSNNDDSDSQIIKLTPRPAVIQFSPSIIYNPETIVSTEANKRPEITKVFELTTVSGGTVVSPLISDTFDSLTDKITTESYKSFTSDFTKVASTEVNTKHNANEKVDFSKTSDSTANIPSETIVSITSHQPISNNVKVNDATISVSQITEQSRQEGTTKKNNLKFESKPNYSTVVPKSTTNVTPKPHSYAKNSDAVIDTKPQHMPVNTYEQGTARYVKTNTSAINATFSNKNVTELKQSEGGTAVLSSDRSATVNPKYQGNNSAVTAKLINNTSSGNKSEFSHNNTSDNNVLKSAKSQQKANELVPKQSAGQAQSTKIPEHEVRNIITTTTQAPTEMNTQKSVSSTTQKVYVPQKITVVTRKPVSRVTQKPISSVTENPSKQAFNKRTSTYTCINGVRGRHSDKNDCRKFYICVGNQQPIVGHCPVNTVFSDIKKLCTKNMSHCIRENQFKCPSAGRFTDFIKDNVYYICVDYRHHLYRFQFQCQKGFTLDKTTVRCTENKQIESNESVSISSIDNDSSGSNIRDSSSRSSSSSSSSSDSSNKSSGSSDVSTKSSISESSDSSSNQSSSNDSSKNDGNGKTRSDNRSKNKKSKEKKEPKEEPEGEEDEVFECEKEGKFPVRNDCRRYYLCKEKGNHYRRKIKKCESGEVFHKDKKKCVDDDSYEC